MAKPIQANVAERDSNIIEIRWQAHSRRHAEADIALFYQMMPVGHKEELTAHRARKNHGQRRSCTMYIRYFDRAVQKWTPEDFIKHFTEVIENRTRVFRKDVGESTHT